MTGPDDRSSFEVPSTVSQERLDTLIVARFGLSRAKVKELFEQGAVVVDGRKAKKGQKVAPGQRISVALPHEEAREAKADPTVGLTLLHQDDWLIAVDKPAGIPSHPLRPGEVGTVASGLIARFPECASASDDPREGGLCHRLDVETSGVLLCARQKETWRKVREAFTDRRVDKRYLSLTTGPIADEGEIDLPLRHHPRRADRVEPAVDSSDGREAISRFRVLERRGELSLIEVQIATGVLHQIRAHLSAIGAPIVGDRLYGGRSEPKLGRFFLHARSVQLEHPATGRPLSVCSPLPEDLRAVLITHGLGVP